MQVKAIMNANYYKQSLIQKIETKKERFLIAPFFAN
jgi:hypothetical protein